MGGFWADLFLLLLISTGLVYGVSFYGDGYIHLRRVDASIQSLLHVRFRTSSQTGLLFLAAGNRDFLLLELISGHLQVRLDLGSGERSLRSEKGIHLGDLVWHSIELTHDHYNISMTIDRNSRISLRMPGPDLELSVEDGLFVGGTAGLKHPYLLNISNGFRGCLDEVVFNEHNLLSNLKPYSGYIHVHEVSLGCSPQFSATVEDPVSFFSSKAFIALPLWEVPQEAVIECELYPSAKLEDGIVLYSSSYQNGYVAVEIRQGHLVATVGSEEGNKTELRSVTNVQINHMWYTIQLRLLPRSVQLKVGKELIKTNLSPVLQVIQLKGPVFLGGLDEQAKAEARRTGLFSASPRRVSSFKGCLRHVTVNAQRMGLPHATVTKDVTASCNRGQAPVMVTTVSPTDHPKFYVTTTQAIGNNNPNILLLRKLQVAEGGQAALEPKHIKMNLDFQKLGIHPSQLIFRIEELPIHGQLRLDQSSNSDGMRWDEGQGRTITIGAEEKHRTFSMLDLWQGRVIYVHSGSEDHSDFFLFSISSSNKKEFPEYLEGSHLHQFDISISSVNDAPVLSLPGGNLFNLVEKSKKQLTTDVLRVSDPDSSPVDLVFSALGNLSSDAGYLEHQDYPGRAIKLFSLHDLEQRKISFVHTGVSTSRLALRVSDGQKVSNAVVLRIMAVAFQHKVVNNTALEVNQGEASIITTSHLAVQTNVANQAVEIRYDIIELPQYGQLQRLHSSGYWKATTSFSQKLLEKEQIRYLSTFHGIQTQNITDHFKCKISIDSLATEEVVFPIMVHWIHFKVTRSKMEVSGVQMAVVTANDFHVISKGVKLNETNLYIRLLTVPKKGQLFLNNQVLQRDSTFSQKNITDGLLKYELLRLFDDTRDMFSFQVFSTHANSSSYDFRINIKAESRAISVVNKVLSVPEGGSKVISKDVLFTHMASNREVQYTITVSPKHGQIRKINISNSTSINDNILTFTNQDIIDEKVMYVHDDSETKQDSFIFQVMVYKPHKNLNKKEDRNKAKYTFNISIQLVNDQRPVRVVDKVFHVAREGQRLVTLNDLCFRDDDLDFEDSWLVYTRRGIPMGELVLASDPSQKLYEFTQRDLEQKKVLFVHRGVSLGRYVLFVSDGKHYVSTLMEVMAQDPYLQVENNTGLMVQRGGITSLTSTNLSVFSNLDIRDPEEVTFEVFLPPKHGVLCFSDGKCDTVTEANAVSVFTQWDVVAGRLVYHHDGSNELTDGFNVTARAREKNTDSRVDRGRREVHLDIGVSVKIYLESHQRPPSVISNHPVVVAEGQNVSVSRGHLEVVHENNQPSEIVFTVHSQPTVGVLQRVFSNNKHNNNTGEKLLHQGIKKQQTTSFTQEDINQGLVIYHQQAIGSINDSVVLEATNGITKVGPIKLEIDIIPILLPLQVSNLTLDEGSSLPLTSDIIRVTSHHFSDMNFLFQVITPPRHGHLEHSRIPGMPITAFTDTEVEREYISYVHDGSDTRRDNFIIMVNQTEITKHSLPRTVHINITPINDETPIVTTNQGLKVWVGSVTEITTDDLSAEDSDTPPEGLEFIVTPPSNGHLALKSAPSRHILNFTQNHIQSRQLVFVHSGALSGGFHFQVNDGVNFAPRQIFSTTAQSLVLSLQKNRPLVVHPGAVVAEGGKVTIDRSKLDASNLLEKVPESHREDHHVLYRVISLPRHGALSIGGHNLTRNQPDFSQITLNNFGITYTHDDSETTSDSFTFRAWVAPLDLSSSSSALSSDSSSSFSPLYLASSSSLSSLDVVSRPNFKDSLTVTETFNITVTPVNDQPPLIRSRAPSMKVVVGERVVLGPDNLQIYRVNPYGQVEDHDTPPEELHYLVISNPNNGYLTLGERPEPVTSFTQYDINHGRLHFIQKGELSTGVFYFNVSDGHHRPLYKLFSLEVIKPSVSMVNNTGLSLVQGRTAVVLTTNQLAAQTNGRSWANITYRVTTLPHHGRIAINDQEVTTFCHEDLLYGHVVYHMTDLSESEDSFQISVSATSPGVDYGNVTAQTVKVTVLPLVDLREPVRVPSGVAVKLGKGMIDASELARISRTNPVFEVLSPPKHGKLVKMTYDPNQASEVLKSFTFRDVVQGRVAIKETLSDNQSTLTTARGHTPARPRNDSFIFLLKAGNVQPAKGELHFTILPHHQMHHDLGGLNKADRASREHTTTRLPTSNRTTTAGKGVGQNGSTVQSGTGVALHPHILSHKNHSRTQHKLKPQNRWGNHTRNGIHGGRSGNSADGGGHSHPPQPHAPSFPEKHFPVIPPDIFPLPVEVLPRPASDPLLIILPLLACLLLIVILVVLILVFRHRKEKQARLQLIQELTAARFTTEDSPYLARSERSLAMPSVVVTPLGSASCPTSPRLPTSPRRRSLAPGMTFWGPFEADATGDDWTMKGGNSTERENVTCCNTLPNVTTGFKTSVRTRSLTPTLKNNQYWV
ncbi:Chondroitin sulfate proteoglycan 4 [Channa argus]|uniref:Chondroitin sulfate proteoglycan 4 n=1 Tax=Channa argus TaxID=215402 RepID=A0A6G1QIX8_CHAAH|nr:Chondroitin sulfate proteoglycan 4 [Channa argus]